MKWTQGGDAGERGYFFEGCFCLHGLLLSVLWVPPGSSEVPFSIFARPPKALPGCPRERTQPGLAFTSLLRGAAGAVCASSGGGNDYDHDYAYDYND